jgi:adenylate cyclase class 2
VSGGAAEREESEVKLPCRNLEELRAQLRSVGASLRAPEHFESNDLYDDGRGALASAGRTLRVREAAGETVLTYKGPARFQSGIKIREERETRVADAGELAGILGGLGFSRRFRYEKRREEWSLHSCIIALDHTPIGDFVEVEGAPDEIRRALAALELDSSTALPYSYARLYRERRKENPGLPEDMIFSSRETENGKRKT